MHVYCGYRSGKTGNPTDIAACASQESRTLKTRAEDRTDLGDTHPTPRSGLVRERVRCHVRSGVLGRFTSEADQVPGRLDLLVVEVLRDPTGSWADEALVTASGQGSDRQLRAGPYVSRGDCRADRHRCRLIRPTRNFSSHLRARRDGIHVANGDLRPDAGPLSRRVLRPDFGRQHHLQDPIARRSSFRTHGPENEIRDRLREPRRVLRGLVLPWPWVGASSPGGCGTPAPRGHPGAAVRGPSVLGGVAVHPTHGPSPLRSRPECSASPWTGRSKVVEQNSVIVALSWSPIMATSRAEVGRPYASGVDFLAQQRAVRPARDRGRMTLRTGEPDIRRAGGAAGRVGLRDVVRLRAYLRQGSNI